MNDLTHFCDIIWAMPKDNLNQLVSEAAERHFAAINAASNEEVFPSFSYWARLHESERSTNISLQRRLNNWGETGVFGPHSLPIYRQGPINFSENSRGLLPGLVANFRQPVGIAKIGDTRAMGSQPSERNFASLIAKWTTSDTFLKNLGQQPLAVYRISNGFPGPNRFVLDYSSNVPQYPWVFYSGLSQVRQHFSQRSPFRTAALSLFHLRVDPRMSLMQPAFTKSAGEMTWHLLVAQEEGVSPVFPEVLVGRIYPTQGEKSSVLYDVAQAANAQINAHVPDLMRVVYESGRYRVELGNE